MEDKTVDIKIAGYENVYVDCPFCKYENIYNRKSDLNTTKPIIKKFYVVCEKCGKKFAIICDGIDRGIYRWFLDELYMFKKRKEYRMYVVNLCQALECFFYQAIINKLFDRNKDYRNEEGNVNIDKYKRSV